MGLREKLYEKIGTVVDNATDIDSLALASGALAKLSEMDAVFDDDKYTIGTPGQIGFGVATMDDFTATNNGVMKMSGTDDVLSSNYGNFLNHKGDVLVYVPKFYFRWSGNDLTISATPFTGGVVHRAFIDGGVEKSGFLMFKYGGSNINNTLSSRPMMDPVSTNSAHNPISNLGASNTYAGAYIAVKTVGSDYHLPSIFQYNALALIAYAHGIASTSTSVCAYKDVLPHLPKGNNNNALKDVNDASVSFTSSGFSNCGLTGSGVPFAKTTHNGQNNGIADLNGNMWEVASGLTFEHANDTAGDFRILKESVSLKSFITATNTTSATTTDAYHLGNYDTINLVDLIPVGAGNLTRFGNGSNAVFPFGTTRTDASYRMACAGLPASTGVSTGGTTAFGTDGLWRYRRLHLAPIVGGYWGDSSAAGVFALNLSNVASDSHNTVGLRASKFV